MHAMALTLQHHLNHPRVLTSSLPLGPNCQTTLRSGLPCRTCCQSSKASGHLLLHSHLRYLPKISQTEKGQNGEDNERFGSAKHTTSISSHSPVPGSFRDWLIPFPDRASLRNPAGWNHRATPFGSFTVSVSTGHWLGRAYITLQSYQPVSKCSDRVKRRDTQKSGEDLMVQFTHMGRSMASLTKGLSSPLADPLEAL